MYLGSAEVSILAFLTFCRINNLCAINRPDGFESRPAHHFFFLYLHQLRFRRFTSKSTPDSQIVPKHVGMMNCDKVIDNRSKYFAVSLALVLRLGVLCPPEARAQVSPTVVSVNFATTTATPLNPGFNGFNSNLKNAVEYYDTNFQSVLAALSPGWLRFPGGTDSEAFDWASGESVSAWVGALAADSYQQGINAAAQPIVAGKGGSSFSDFAGMAAKVGGAKIIVSVNAFTDTLTLTSQAFQQFLLPTKYSQTLALRGTIQFQTTSPGQISVLGVRANGIAALTTLPVLSDGDLPGGSISDLTYGGGFVSMFYLVNTGTAPASFTLSFYNQSGAPVSVPLSLPQTTSTQTTAALTQTLIGNALAGSGMDSREPDDHNGS